MQPYVKQTVDIDPIETEEWVDSLRYVIHSRGVDRAKYLLSVLEARAKSEGVDLPLKSNTPYMNTIHIDQQPPYPGNREIERRIKSIIRWNAMAMVVRGNKSNPGLGGHLSTYASSATLYEVAFNHIFRGRGETGYDGDLVYFQGHGSPGIYARAFLEGRLDEENLENFRLEASSPKGLSSYPHSWLMPEFWEYPTVSMGLGPIMAIYQARFNRYLHDRGLKDTSRQRVWAFLGDGECDEPESLGAITLAAREHLDNLCFVINCNLQRLDGPVRGNGKIIQELEGIFRGAGWNVIKVVWGDEWDSLLERDEKGLLVKRMGEVVDGQFQKYVVSGGDYIRQHFFGTDPELLEMVKNLSDEKLARLRRGGHDPEKVFAAYQAAINHKGQPTVILAKTIKGYGLSGGAGRNIAHNKKAVEIDELMEFRTRFGIPISDNEVGDAPFYRPAEDSAEIKYIKERRKALGGSVPSRPLAHPKMETPSFDSIRKVVDRDNGKEISTTMGFGRLLSKLCQDKVIGKHIVPIIPDESRTFGMEGMFKQVGIYSHVGQLYEPVDAEGLTPYREAKDGQLLEEGISEAGAMSSFNAAGTAYSAHGINMIPFYIFYSMFGFQRIGDLVWAGADMRAKGFLLGATAGRTTLNGEGLQHQDGNSLLYAMAFPTVRAFDPAFHYEVAYIIMDGLRRLYQEGDTAIYYLMVGNENYEMPAMPDDAGPGIIKGLYKFRSLDVAKSKHRVQLFGSGAIMTQVMQAQQILAERYKIASDLWSATSYTELFRDAQTVQRWNMLHPTEKPRQSYLDQLFQGVEGPFIAASDYVRGHTEQIRQYLPGDFYTLGTDGMGRSDTRKTLRRHFEVDAESVVIATLFQLSKQGKIKPEEVAKAIKELDFDPEKVDPLYA
ncbi:MAG TPA: pyruvate dehydrogenase (acetyl-transferring), homodimeric type [Pirellulaceae bacterium]|nr:pyruvate dehydrogenase (acetyl-transferring), homodimeric type [Pirellulaceae bacterium]